MDLSTMTLGEFFALADRVGEAARVIREAQAMMGGGSPVAPSDAPKVIHLPLTPPGHPLAGRIGDVLMTNKGPVRLTDEELAQREALRREREAEELAADRAKLAGTS